MTFLKGVTNMGGLNRQKTEELNNLIKKIYPTYDNTGKVYFYKFEIITSSQDKLNSFEVLNDEKYEKGLLAFNGNQNSFNELLDSDTLLDFKKKYADDYYPDEKLFSSHQGFSKKSATEFKAELDRLILAIDETMIPTKNLLDTDATDFFKSKNLILGNGYFTNNHTTYELGTIRKLYEKGLESSDIKRLFIEYTKNRIVHLLLSNEEMMESRVGLLLKLIISKNLTAKSTNNIQSPLYTQFNNSDNSIKSFYSYGCVFKHSKLIQDQITISKSSKRYLSFMIQAVRNLFDKWEMVNNQVHKNLNFDYYVDVNSIIQLTVRDLTEGNNIPNHELYCVLSSTPYEGQYSHKGCFVFPDTVISHNCFVLFSNPIDFSIENIRFIRKLLEMTNSDLHLVVQENRIVGLTEASTYLDAFKVVFNGYMKWSLIWHQRNNEDSSLLHYNQGNYIYGVRTTEDIFTNLKKIIHEKNSFAKIEQVINECFKQENGALIVLFQNSSDASFETNRLAKKGRALSFSKPVSLSKFPSSIINLSGIDGAVAMDFSGNCYGCGLILDGEAVSRGTPERGARYNSGKNYVQWVKDRVNDKSIDCLVLIISEDGSIDLIDYDIASDVTFLA